MSKMTGFVKFYPRTVRSAIIPSIAEEENAPQRNAQSLLSGEVRFDLSFLNMTPASLIIRSASSARVAEVEGESGSGSPSLNMK